MEIIENLRNDTHENKQNLEKIKVYIPTQENSKNIINTENNSNKLRYIQKKHCIRNNNNKFALIDITSNILFN